VSKIIDKELYRVLLAPKITEKATRLEVDRQYVFCVKDGANKQEIKSAVESMFNVVVESVKTCNMKGKIKNFGRIPGRRKSWKKAYVMLAPGNLIKFGGA